MTPFRLNYRDDNHCEVDEILPNGYVYRLIGWASRRPDGSIIVENRVSEGLPPFDETAVVALMNQHDS